MSELLVLAFDQEQDAYGLRGALRLMTDQGLVELEDAAIVVRRQDGTVKIDQLGSLVGKGSLGGGVLGLLLGITFLAPGIGLAIGAVAGGLIGKFKDIGVDDAFIMEIGSTIEPGHSALFLLAKDRLSDEALDMIKFKMSRARLLRTTMNTERVEEVFGGGETA